MIINKEFSRELAAHLLDIDAVRLRPKEPFKWTSGWNSPIYCDNRLTLRYPEIRKKIAQNFSAFIIEKYPDVDVITGTSTAGIPHAAWVAGKLDKPMAYVRAKAKAHGMGNQIEGGVDKGQTTIIIEDLISTGGSAISVLEALQFVGAKVPAVLAIFNYGFEKAQLKFDNKNTPLYTLTDYETLIEVAVEKGIAGEEDLEQLKYWRQSPDTWPS